MSQYRYQFRIMLDSGFVHVTETYTDPFPADAFRRARLTATSRTSAVDIVNDQGETVFIRTTKIASIKICEVDNPPSRLRAEGEP